MKKPLGEKMEFFRQYDEVLFNQLEKKIIDLETANQQLRISLKESQLQFENISDVVFMIGTDFKILSISPSVEKILGYKAEDFIGRPVSDLRHIFTPESFERVITTVSKILQGERIPANNYDFVAKDGTLRHIEIHGSPIIHDGQIAGTISVARDITERKKAEFQREAALEALRESEKRYRRIAENMSDLVSDVNADGFFQYLSPSHQRILGYRPEDLLGTAAFDKIHPDDKDQVLSVFMEGVMTKTDRKFEYRYRHADGHYIWMRSSGHIILDGAGEYFGSIINSSDITDRKLMEEKLRESEANYRHLYNNVPAAIYRIDFKNQKLLEVNDVFYKYLGFSKEEITSLSPYGLLTEESRKLFMERVGKMAQGIEVPTAVEYEIFNKKGDRLWMRLDNNYIYDTEGQVIAANVVAHDITEHKLAEEKIRASLREKEILISEIHHRVKNNLQVISSLLGLQARSSGNPELTEMLNGIQSRIGSMAMIHEKLYDKKDFTRIELSSYVKALSQSLFNTHNINPGKIGLTVQSDGEIYVDITKAIPCGLILNELISNALKHAFPGDRKGELQIIISETKNAETDIVVRDNGVGLPDNIDIHQPQTLGLELVNGLVKNQLDGQIEVRRDAGTQIHLKFPI